MANEIKFTIRVVFKNKETNLDVSYSIDIKLEDILDEVFDHVGLEEDQRSELEVITGE